MLLVALSIAAGCTRRDPAAEHAALAARGREIFTRRCGPCHGPEADWPIETRLKGRTVDEFVALFDHLPAVNPIMPSFDDAPAADHRAVAVYLVSLEHAAGAPAAPGRPPGDSRR